jgi:acetolactate synthase-1/2/3 large subunit
VSAISELLVEAWRIALTPPSGPVYLEIPVDVLKSEAADATVGSLALDPLRQIPARDALAAAAGLLSSAQRPVVWAGGGVLRSRAQDELRAVAEKLDAAVATTYMGKAALSDDHPLAVGCGCDEAAFQELISDADVVLCVGTELGAETTGQYELRFGGRVIQIDAAPERIGTTYAALPLVGDAKATLSALLELLEERPRSNARERVAQVRARIRAGLESQGRQTELDLLATIEQALESDAVSAWDMTILSYWAAPHLRLVGNQTFLYPLGSGTLGYAWPAAIGASLARPQQRVLAVVGDGGLHYALGELASARQHAAGAKLLLIDDGGYGILREYQKQAYGETTAVDLVQPDFVALANAFGIPARAGGPERLAENLDWAFSLSEPAMVVVSGRLTAAEPTR